MTEAARRFAAARAASVGALALAGALAIMPAADATAREPSKTTREKGKMRSTMELAATELNPSHWGGQSCAVSEPSAQIIATSERWTQLWKTFLRQPAPAVDFDKYFAVAVFLGLRNTGGYSAEFLEPMADGARARIRYRERAPEKGAFVIQAFTQPYAIQLYRKTRMELSVVEER